MWKRCVCIINWPWYPKSSISHVGNEWVNIWCVFSSLVRAAASFFGQGTHDCKKPSLILLHHSSLTQLNPLNLNGYYIYITCFNLQKFFIFSQRAYLCVPYGSHDKQHKPVGLFSRHSVFLWGTNWILIYCIDKFQSVNSQYYTHIKVLILFFFHYNFSIVKFWNSL
jgi:hypothetical protein